jgi:hypothetical protein
MERVILGMNGHSGAVRTGMAKKRAAACIIVFLAALSFVHANDIDVNIMGDGRLSKKDMVDFLLLNNRNLVQYKGDVEALIETYIKEAKDEGVNHDIAFAQMCYHTNYLSFFQTFVKPRSYNFCGLASLPTTSAAHRFEDRGQGVRAHIQHLKGYATIAPPINDVVDPRYGRIPKGSAQRLSQLSGRWAGSDYARKVESILRTAYNKSEDLNTRHQSVSNSRIWF